MFYVAYVVKQEKGAAKRPVTFLFNGGPGSASLWLNVGGLGPMYAVTDAPRATGPAPYTFVPSPNSILDKTDLVFLDAIGTGYSRPLGTAKGPDFWGVDADVDSFARAITRYISVNRRWGSPKFLFGESYGTTRASALVYKLQNQGMQFTRRGAVVVDPELCGVDAGYRSGLHQQCAELRRDGALSRQAGAEAH